MEITPDLAVAGIDVGFGNTKAVGGSLRDPHPRSVVMPVGAAPIEQCDRHAGGGGYDLKGGTMVEIDGSPWVAGIDPMGLSKFERVIHQDYPSTNEYKALFIAALARLGLREVDCVYTGLPVSQFYGASSKELRTSISHALTGRHQVSAGHSIQVRKVRVVPQAAGAFMDAVDRNPALAERPGVRVMVVDVGFYSVDYVMMIEGGLREESSGSSVDATSVILAGAAQLITSKYKTAVSAQRLESVFRRGETRMAVGAEDVEIAPFLARAAEPVTERVFNAIRNDLRRERDAINAVVLTGGGAQLYKAAAEKVFGPRAVSIGRDPVMANAMGFYMAARNYAINAGTRAA